HPARYFLNVGIYPLADRGDLVDETDLCREKRVGGVLDHLCRANVGRDDRRLRLEVAVRTGNTLARVAVGAAGCDAVGRTETHHSGAPAQTLGVAHAAESAARAVAAALERRKHPVAGADRHGAFVHHDQLATGRRVAAEALHCRAYLAHVGLTF